MVSVIIPARNERFLQHTIDDLLKNARGAVEIICILDGYWPDPQLTDDSRVKLIHHGQAKGMRAGINAGVALAKGDFVMKIDGHCMVGEGWDTILAADCEPNWVVVPRRKRLDAENWCIQETGKPDIDYMYLSYPDDPSDFGGPGLNGKNWDDRNRNESLKEVLIDDVMSGQGSCWFMHRDYFCDLELMDEANYGPFWNESQEIMLKCWLSGGRCIVNKKTWYAHLHKGKKYGRGYHLPETWLTQGRNHTMLWLRFGHAWDKQTLPLEWLINKFSPVPGWPAASAFTTTAVKGKRDRLVKLFADQGFTKGAEIGVSGGRFSEQLWKGIPGLHMTGVDPYSAYPGYQWGGRQERHDNHRHEARTRYNQYGGTLLEMPSREAVSRVADGSLDFVYIDGNHTYQHVKDDIALWAPKVKRGGIVSGHDYFHFRNAGVVQAVNEYVTQQGIPELFINTERETSWWFYKP